MSSGASFQEAAQAVLDLSRGLVSEPAPGSPLIKTKSQLGLDPGSGGSGFKFKSINLGKNAYLALALFLGFFVCILTQVMAFADNVVTSVQF